MIKSICLLLIGFYQRFLSPVKGFNCAHHKLHQGDTCSDALRLSKARFKECKTAYIKLAQQATVLEKADLPCDIGCAGDPGCFDGLLGSDASNSSCTLPCDLCFEFPNLKRRTRIILLGIVTISFLALAYYYGSRITKLEVTEVSIEQRSEGFFKKLITRDTPSLRAALITSSKTIYSNIVDSSALAKGEVITLTFSNSIEVNRLRRIELQDARFSAVKDLIVVGQIIDEIEHPELSGSGTRYKYEFKSRWGL